MNRYFYHRRPGLFIEPRCHQSISSSGPSQSHTTTGTTSGQASPVAAEGSQAVGSGSIGVAGQGAKYIESGGTDQSNADLSTRISAGTGSTVTIGDPNANQTISQLAQSLATASQGGSSSSPLIVPLQQAASSIPWATVGIITGVVLLLMLLPRLFKKS